MKSKKGITLIALIITIIVMLILVSVTITIAVNGGLFGYARNAATGTNNALTEENKLGSGTVNFNGTDASIGDVVNNYIY